MPAIDMTKIYGNKNYKGNWVAINSDTYEIKPEVIAFGKTLNAVLEKAKRKGFNLPLITRIPKKILPIVGSII